MFPRSIALVLEDISSISLARTPWSHAGTPGQGWPQSHHSQLPSDHPKIQIWHPSNCVWVCGRARNRWVLNLGNRQGVAGESIQAGRWGQVSGWPCGRGHCQNEEIIFHGQCSGVSSFDVRHQISGRSHETPVGSQFEAFARTQSKLSLCCQKRRQAWPSLWPETSWELEGGALLHAASAGFGSSLLDPTHKSRIRPSWQRSWRPLDSVPWACWRNCRRLDASVYGFLWALQAQMLSISSLAWGPSSQFCAQILLKSQIWQRVRTQWLACQ